MPRRLPMPTREELLRVLVREGCIIDTAAHFGVGRTTIQQWKSTYRVDKKEYRTGHSTYKKLEKADIPLIRELHAGGMTAAEIAKKFEVVHATIANIVHGKTWGWVE